VSEARAIWVVEKDDAKRQALIHVLRDGGFSTRGFAEPAEVVRQARIDPPAAVITQRVTDRLSEMLRHELGPATPRLVLVTSDRVPRVALTAFDRVIAKPFATSHLLDVLRALTRNRTSGVRLLRPTPRNGLIRSR
jgi:DNA-binding response OmpR family regulator